MHPDDPIDFGPLDARRYSGAEDRVVGGAMREIRVIAAREQPAADRRSSWREELFSALFATPRIMLPAAACVLVAATIAAMRAPGAHRRTERPATVAEALGVPPALANLEAGRAPSSAELWSLAATLR